MSQAASQPIEILKNPPTAFPRRIVCLTEETTETLYLLGEQDRIVGVSGYTVRPPEARKKPKVSAFITAKFEKIIDLKPDLVFAFSDLQADITAELMRRGVSVFAFNQRGVGEILEMILTVARIVGCPEKGERLVSDLQADLTAVLRSAAQFPRRPRVFFEEWHDPLISGIRWTEELVEIAGGEPLFPELRQQPSAKHRIVAAEDVARHDPEVIIASWCGRHVRKPLIRQRSGWENVAAVRNNHIYEVKSAYILQPGPAALTEGVKQLHALLAHVVGVEPPSELRSQEATDLTAPEPGV
jgi:iron complex transport system substrate-binding protein